MNRWIDQYFANKKAEEEQQALAGQQSQGGQSNPIADAMMRKAMMGGGGSTAPAAGASNMTSLYPAGGGFEASMAGSGAGSGAGSAAGAGAGGAGLALPAAAVLGAAAVGYGGYKAGRNMGFSPKDSAIGITTPGMVRNLNKKFGWSNKAGDAVKDAGSWVSRLFK